MQEFCGENYKTLMNILKNSKLKGEFYPTNGVQNTLS